jgi:hypothetical protein
VTVKPRASSIAASTTETRAPRRRPGPARLASPPTRSRDRAWAQRLRFRPLKPRRLPLRLNERPGGGRSLPPLAWRGSNGRGPAGRGGRSSAALTVSRRPSTSRS